MIGTVLGGYRLTELIGSGGMARVFCAEHTETKELVAIKTLPEEFHDDATFRLRFQREIDAISRLDHPHILPLMTYGETDHVSYMVMPFMSYGTLYDKLLDSQLSTDECLRLIAQIGSAIDHAHEHQIIHRDLKPANIMLDRRGDICLADFGIAKLIEDTSVDITGSAIVGTWHYMSPEQCMGEKDLLPQSDIYALGVVLHEMLTGRAPFHEASPAEIVQRHMTASISLADDLDDRLPPDVKFVILKALARKPTRRYKSGMSMVKALRRALKQNDAD